MSDKETVVKQKTPWLPMLLIGVFCSGIAGGGVYWYGNKQLEEAKASFEPGAKAKKPSAPVVVETPIYLKIAPFTVNIKTDLNPGSRSRLLYSGISFKLGDKESEKFLSEHMTEIRSRLLMIVADCKAEVLVTPEGKADLTNKIKEMLKLPFSDPQPEIVVNEILFTDFIVQ